MKYKQSKNITRVDFYRGAGDTQYGCQPVK